MFLEPFRDYWAEIKWHNAEISAWRIICSTWGIILSNRLIWSSVFLIMPSHSIYGISEFSKHPDMPLLDLQTNKHEYVHSSVLVNAFLTTLIMLLLPSCQDTWYNTRLPIRINAAGDVLPPYASAPKTFFWINLNEITLTWIFHKTDDIDFFLLFCLFFFFLHYYYFISITL